MYDYHIHPHHSADGQMSLREMALSAIEKGFLEICSTAHFDIDFPLAPHMNFVCDLTDYVEDVERYANRFADQIVIKTGLEVGMQAGRADVFAKTREALEGKRFDYIIGSIHWMESQNSQWRTQGVHPIWGNGATRADVLRRYAAALLQCAKEFPEFDCIGHLTYYSRWDPHEDSQMCYSDAPEELDALFTHLVHNGKGIEVNTSTRKRKGYFMPDFDMLKRYQALGGEIVTIGSDAHWPKHIGDCYTDACAMLKEAGFSYICTFADHKPAFVRI